eukprot:scaffold116690_cov30-Tisochrysis_lutea.AAC.2
MKNVRGTCIRRRPPSGGQLTRVAHERPYRGTEESSKNLRVAYESRVAQPSKEVLEWPWRRPSRTEGDRPLRCPLDGCTAHTKARGGVAEHVATAGEERPPPRKSCLSENLI